MLIGVFLSAYMCMIAQRLQTWKLRFFRPLFCTERLNWAGDTPGRMRQILDETCPRGRIELTT